MPVESSIPLRAVRPLVARLQASGVDAPAILREVGVDLARVFDPTERISFDAWLTLWRRAELLTRDPSFGVRSAELVDFRIFLALNVETEYLLVQLAASSPTVGASLAVWERFYPIGFGPTRIEAVRTGDAVELRFTVPGAEPAPSSLVEASIATIGVMLRDLAERPVTLSYAFAHRAPPSLVEHRRILAAPIEFDAGRDALIVPRAALAVPLRSTRPELVARLTRRAEEALARLELPASFTDQVLAVMEKQLEHAESETAEGIARAMRVSVRTLSRRLAAAGTSHRALLDQLRSRLARRFLSEGEMSIRDIARRLGFADASAFHRAFKRWYGVSPAELRRDPGE